MLERKGNVVGERQRCERWVLTLSVTGRYESLCATPEQVKIHKDSCVVIGTAEAGWLGDPRVD